MLFGIWLLGYWVQIVTFLTAPLGSLHVFVIILLRWCVHQGSSLARWLSFRNSGWFKARRVTLLALQFAIFRRGISATRPHWPRSRASPRRCIFYVTRGTTNRRTAMARPSSVDACLVNFYFKSGLQRVDCINLLVAATPIGLYYALDQGPQT